DVRVLLVQFFGQSLSLFLCEADRSGSDPSAECGLPVDGVGSFATPGFHGCCGTNRLLGLAIHSFSFSGSCVTRHSDVSSNPTLEAAFCRAARVTLVGSTTPALT